MSVISVDDSEYAPLEDEMLILNIDILGLNIMSDVSEFIQDKVLEALDELTDPE
jgi:succinate dehydrogenase flavin-adding protein (antitoxin of CptAB toxin-antitoxin module)